MKKEIHDNASRFQKIISHMKAWTKNSHTCDMKNFYKYLHTNPNVNFFRYISKDQSNIPLQYILDIDDLDDMYLFQLNYENILAISSIDNI